MVWWVLAVLGSVPRVAPPLPAPVVSTGGGPRVVANYLTQFESRQDNAVSAGACVWCGDGCGGGLGQGSAITGEVRLNDWDPDLPVFQRYGRTWAGCRSRGPGFW